MRVDTATGSTAQFDNVDALARLKGYVSALRRRWYLVVIPMLLGAGLGWLSTPGTAEGAKAPGIITAAPTYMRATHVLIDSSQGTNQGSTVNLPQAAYLVNTGEVPKRVAERLGLPLKEVRESLLGIPLPPVSSVQVQAIGKDGAKAVKIADAAAEELLVELEAKAKAEAQAELDQIFVRLDQFDQQIDDLTAQLAGEDVPDREQLEGQLRSATNQYSATYDQLQQLQPTPSAGLKTLEPAKAEEITEAQYKADQKAIREGADYLNGVTATTVPEENASAEPSTGASAPTRMVFGGLAGLGLGIGLVLLLDRFDSRLRRREDVEAATGLAVVAEIPPLSRHQQNAHDIVARTEHRSRAAEAYRVVRGAVLFALGVDDDRAGREGATVLMVTSANPAEGKTTTVANLAAVLAEGGFTVLVINCDFRRPQVHKYLLAQHDKAAAPFSAVARFGSVVVTNTNIDRVRLITGLGEDDPDANPLDVVALQRKVIQATRDKFDMILLDTAPFLTTNDASELLSETDRVLVVVRGGKTKVEAARRTAEILERFDAPVLGVVMNDSTEAEQAQYYYAGYSSTGEKRGRNAGARETAPAIGSAGNGVANGSNGANGANGSSVPNGANGSKGANGANGSPSRPAVAPQAQPEARDTNG